MGHGAERVSERQPVFSETARARPGHWRKVGPRLGRQLRQGRRQGGVTTFDSASERHEERVAVPVREQVGAQTPEISFKFLNEIMPVSS